MKNKIVYENIPYGAKENSTTITTDKQEFVDMEDLKEKLPTQRNATLEKNRWKLDGSFLVFPNTPKDLGYISKSMSNSNGVYENNIVLTRTYDTSYTSPRNKHYI